MQSDGSAMGAHKMCFDVASVLWQGARPYQEDSLLQDFVDDGARGYVVLADGMGGHAAGDVASGLAVQTVSRSLGQAIHEGEDFETNIAAHLRAAVRRANRALADEAGGASGTARMGTTLITAILCDARLYWTSVGDSPLYLWRDGRLRLLNEDHSMAPVIDRMVEQGELSAEAGRNHPDRNALTSVLSGTEVARIDLSADGFDLRPDDVLIVASDGLQFLDLSRIECILAEMAPHAPSARIPAIALVLAAQAAQAQDGGARAVCSEGTFQLVEGQVCQVGATGRSGFDTSLLTDANGRPIQHTYRSFEQAGAGAALLQALDNGDITADG